MMIIWFPVIAVLLGVTAFIFGSPRGILKNAARGQRLAAIGITSALVLGTAAVAWQPVKPLETMRPEAALMPNQAGYWVAKGQAHMKNAGYDEAAAAFLQALELSGPRADLYETLGEALIFGDAGAISQKAIEAFERALELDPSRERSRYILAEALYRSGDKEAGTRAFIDLLEDTSDPSFQTFLQDRIDAAIGDMKAELEQLAGDINAEHNVDDLSAALTLNPNDLDGWIQLIQTHARSGNQPRARKALEDAALVFVTKPEALQKLMALGDELDLSRGPQVPPGAEPAEGSQ